MTTTQETHVVLGSGPLGRATAAALVAAGRQVRLINRSGALPDAPSGVALDAADLTDAGAARAACAGAEAVYFCAQPPYHKWPELFPALQEAAIAGAEAAGARLVVAENMYGYGEVDGPMMEDFPLRATTRKGRARARLHEDLMRAHAAGRVEATVARGSDFFGPFVVGSAVGARLFAAVVAGRAAEVFGDPDAPHSFTFVEDFGAAMAALGTDARAVGQVWHVPNAPAVSQRAFVELAFGLAERPVRMRTVSVLEMRLVGLFAPPARETIEMLYEFEAPFVVDHRKFAGVFGDISTPLQAALARTVDWTRRGR